MNNKLSHSSISKYLLCPTAYKHHYRNGYRTSQLSASLLFGSAIDKAMEYLLTEKSGEGHEDGYATAEDYFDYHWTHQYVNNELTNIFECADKFTYSSTDVDLDLLTEEEMKDESKRGWYSLRKKGHLMIKVAREKFIPLVEKVYSTQEKIELTNEDGDSSIGFCDAVVKLSTHDKPVILDFKTAGRPYSMDSVKDSVQLAQYLHDLSHKYESTRLAGYCVFLKKIIKNKSKVCSKCNNDGSNKSHKTCDATVEGKRCHGDWIVTLNPECEMQLIVDEIPLDKEEIIIDNIAMVNTAIKANIFYKNVNKCKDTGYGYPCEFYKLCWENNPEGLYKKEEKENV